ncbi:helix-turn-helix domain-containing protein [Cellulosimicrobium cellulans]|uniref:helix-turn-helix domain-containing protein n=1 Tax=Cellulosimicrobium cellulans TaxID=1710 RepID=UPI003AF99A7A
MRDVLPQFREDRKHQSAREEIARLDAFVAEHYTGGSSLREIAELTGRTQTAIRRSLDRTGTPRRGRGAPTTGTVRDA